MWVATRPRARFPAAGSERPGTAGAGSVSETSDGGRRVPSDGEIGEHLISLDVCWKHSWSRAGFGDVLAVPTAPKLRAVFAFTE